MGAYYSDLRYVISGLCNPINNLIKLMNMWFLGCLSCDIKGGFEIQQSLDKSLIRAPPGCGILGFGDCDFGRGILSCAREVIEVLRTFVRGYP